MPKRILTDEQELELVEFYKACRNGPKTAEKFGVSTSSVGNIAKKHGFSIGSGYGSYARKMDLPMDEVVQKYQDGMTCEELSQCYGLDREQIRRRLKRRGVQMRRGGARTPQHNSQWNGGKEYCGDDAKYQYRKFVKSLIGDLLDDQMVIHHHNENPFDQSIDNLWLFPTAGHHARYHGRLRALRNRDPEAAANLSELAFDGVPLRSLICQTPKSPDTN